MRHPAAVALLSVTVVISAAMADDPSSPPNILLNPGAEAGKGDLPSVWSAASGPSPKGLRMTRAIGEAHDGRASLAIHFEGQADPPVAFNWVQSLARVPAGRTVRLRAWIKARDADAVNVCLQCWGKGGAMLAFASTPVFRGDQEWAEARSEPVRVPEGTSTVLVRAALTGRGSAWFDDLAVTVEDEPAAVGAAPKPSSDGEVVVFQYPEARPPDVGKRDGDDDPGLVKGYIRRVGAAPRTSGGEPTVSLEPALAAAVKGRVIRALPLEKDCMIISYLADWCRGDVDNLCLANYGGGCRVLIGLPAVPHFDVAEPGKRFILALYSHRATEPKEPGVVLAEAIGDEWGEQTSWKTRPVASGPAIGTYAFTPSVGWKLLDVTPAVRAAEGNHLGLMLRFDDEAAPRERLESYFSSREAEGPDARRPLLLIVEEPGTGAK